MNDKYIRQMKKGVLDMLVLKLLKSDQKYGYQLISELKEKSGELFILKEGTLYPVLWPENITRLPGRAKQLWKRSDSCGRRCVPGYRKLWRDKR